MLAGTDNRRRRSDDRSSAASRSIAVSSRWRFLLQILGDELLDDDARLMEDHMAEPDAIGDGGSLERDRPAAAQCHRPAGRSTAVRRGDHFGEQHGGRLQRFDLFLRISPAGAVLDDEHAERIAAAQNWHAEEGGIDFFARLRPVREGPMRLRIRERRGSAVSAIRPTRPSPARMVVRWTASRFRPSVAESSQPAVAAHHVDRADFGHHIGGDGGRRSCRGVPRRWSAPP